MATEWISPTWRMPEESNQSKFENYSLSFDGASYIDTSISTLTGTDFSISYWFKTTATLSAFNYYVPFSAVTNYQFTGAYLYFLGTLTVGSKNNAGTFVRGTTDLSDGNWHHIVVTYDISSYALKMYVDGSIDYDETISSINNFNQPLLLGGKTSSQYLINCSIDQAAYWDKILNQSEITALYNSGTPVNPMAITPPPTAYYPLGGSSTGSASTLTIPNSSVPSATVFDFVSADGDRI